MNQSSYLVVVWKYLLETMYANSLLTIQSFHGIQNIYIQVLLTCCWNFEHETYHTGFKSVLLTSNELGYQYAPNNSIYVSPA